MNGSSTGIARLGAVVAFILVLAAGLATVLQRIGVPPTVLAGIAAAAMLAVGTLAGLGGGTMRLPVFLLGRHDLPIAAVGVILATVVAAAGAVHPLVALIALGLWALITAPVLRRTGAPGLPGALGHLFRNPPLRVLLSIIVGVSSLVCASARIGDAAALLGPILRLSSGQAIALVTLALAMVLAPGGMASAARAAVALGIAAVLAIIGMAAAAVVDGRLTAEAMAQAASPARDPFAAQAMAVFAIVVSPQLALLVPTGIGERSVKEGGLWAALSAALLATLATSIAGLPPSRTGADLVQALASLSAQASVSLTAAMLATQAAALAWGYELRGRMDRKRHSTSKRFALVRLSVLVCAAAAGFAATFRPGVMSTLEGPCAVLLVATAGPPLLLGAVLPRPGQWSGLLAAVGGLAVAALLLEGRLAPGWTSPEAALLGLGAGLLIGGSMAVMERRALPPAAPIEEAAL